MAVLSQDAQDEHASFQYGALLITFPGQFASIQFRWTSYFCLDKMRFPLTSNNPGLQLPSNMLNTGNYVVRAAWWTFRHCRLLSHGNTRDDVQRRQRWIEVATLRRRFGLSENFRYQTQGTEWLRRCFVLVISSHVGGYPWNTSLFRKYPGNTSKIHRAPNHLGS